MSEEQVIHEIFPLKADFQSEYIRLREKEGRLYPDEIVRQLPLIPAGHVHGMEWKVRRSSSYRLLRYLRRKSKPLRILEVGCGNGWLSFRFSQITRSLICGIDINALELEQAKRVFGQKENLQFLECRLEEVEQEDFDIVVFAASIQYFPSLGAVLQNAIDKLVNGGEVHILDSHFYKAEEKEAARQRSSWYFSQHGMLTMQQFYFHHRLADLEGFDHEVMQAPATRLGKWLGNSPFHWIRIIKK